jgi:hypothetical protein
MTIKFQEDQLQGLEYVRKVLIGCEGCIEMQKTTERENKPDLFILDTSTKCRISIAGEIFTSGRILRGEGRKEGRKEGIQRVNVGMHFRAHS